MLGGRDLEEILQWHQEGLSIREISRLTGLDRKTVRKYLRRPELPQYGPRAARLSKLSPHHEFIEQRLKDGVWNAVVLFRELQQQGYTGGYTMVKQYLNPLRRGAKVIAVRRFETAPGHQAQVDWGSVGYVENEEEKRALSAFVMTLGCSRAMFAGITEDETLPRFLRMHEEAFQELGGVPKEILYDRPKTVVLGIDERGEIQWNPTFLDFSRYWGYVPRLCRGYRPQTKGKVESGIKYLKGNFLCGRSATSVLDLQRQLKAWTAEIANARVHGTTFRIIAEAHAEEKPHLQATGVRPAYPLPEELFPTRRVARDAYISYGANRYSVPFRAVGQEVAVREGGGKLQVSLRGECLAEHLLSKAKHQVITVSEHIEGIPLGPGSRAKKNQIEIHPDAPEVQTRALAQYEALAEFAEFAEEASGTSAGVAEGQAYHV